MTQEPLNYEGPLAADVVQRVSDFLRKPVENDTGGWTEVSREDWTELVEIFGDILDAKFERDPDGDHTIEFDTCHRQYGRMEVVRVPYNVATDADMERAVHAIRMASGIVERLSHTMSFTIAERRRADARLKKMKVVTNFCASNGHIRAHDRIQDYITGENSSLFVGTDDSVWAPLGLTCAELKQVIKDNLGRGQLHDEVDKVLINAANCMEGNT